MRLHPATYLSAADHCGAQRSHRSARVATGHKSEGPVWRRGAPAPVHLSYQPRPEVARSPPSPTGAPPRTRVLFSVAVKVDAGAAEADMREAMWYKREFIGRAWTVRAAATNHVYARASVPRALLALELNTSKRAPPRPGPPHARKRVPIRARAQPNATQALSFARPMTTSYNDVVYYMCTISIPSSRRADTT